MKVSHQNDYKSARLSTFAGIWRKNVSINLGCTYGGQSKKDGGG